jgi:hypothetical protein
MAYSKMRMSAANPAVTNRFVVSTNMVNGNYTIANATMPTTPGARRITATITANTGNDTPGTLAITGTDLRGNTQTETLTLVAAGTATSAKFYVTITQLTQAGWVINGGNDTIVVGAEAGVTVADGQSQLFAIVVNTTAAGTVTATDSSGVFASLKASIAEATYYYLCDTANFLKIDLAAASDVTVIFTAPTPLSYAL